jgi:hypothetical protein
MNLLSGSFSDFYSALLGYNLNIVPSGARNACTAVDIKVRYNSDDRPEALFKATISFVNVEVLETYITKVKKHRSNIEKCVHGEHVLEDGSDSEDDDELYEIGLIWDRLSALFQSLESRSSIANYDTAVLIEEASRLVTFGSSISIEHSDADKFEAELQTYITKRSTGHEDESLARWVKDAKIWPLIDTVEIFVKSDILRPNIAIYDLPGLGDSNMARWCRAKKILDRLDVICLVVDAGKQLDARFHVSQRATPMLFILNFIRARAFSNL